MKNNLNILYYLCPIGQPNLGSKTSFLKHNLVYINDELNKLKENKKISNFSLTLFVNTYAGAPGMKNIKKVCDSMDFLSEVTFHRKEGYLTEVFLDNPHNKKASNYDYVFFILDDVKIKRGDFNLERIFESINRHKLDALTPLVEKASPWTTYNKPNVPKRLRHLTAAEIYLFIIAGGSFRRFLSFFTKRNCAWWGLDFCWGKLNFKVGFSAWDEVDHLYRNNTRDQNKINWDRMFEWISRRFPKRPRQRGLGPFKKWAMEEGRNSKSPKQEPHTIKILEEDPLFFNKKKSNSKDIDQNIDWPDGPRFNKDVDPQLLLPNMIGSTKQIATNNLKEISFDDFNNFSHKEKYEWAIHHGWCIHNGRQLISVQPEYDPNLNLFHWG
tara:strand:+ start:155 stop:1303 length:1149 start_codon:yes stop_codon:yes gene_type:complete